MAFAIISRNIYTQGVHPRKQHPVLRRGLVGGVRQAARPAGGGGQRAPQTADRWTQQMSIRIQSLRKFNFEASAHSILSSTNVPP